MVGGGFIVDDMDGLLNGRRVLSGEYSGYPRDSGTAVLLVCMLGNTSFLTRSHVLMNKNGTRVVIVEKLSCGTFNIESRDDGGYLELS